MTDRTPEEDQPALALDAIRRAGLSIGEVWVHYLSMGGWVDEYEVTAYLHGLMQLDDLNRDMIAQSVNELYDDVCRSPRAPFAADLR